MSKQVLLTLFVALNFVWLGMVLAISFLEAPVKFTTPSLTRPVALDVGRVVFTAFHWVQGGLFVIGLALLVGLKASSIKIIVPYVALTGVLILQSFWLLPVLSARAAAVLQNLELSPSPVHIIYVLLEVGKIVILLWLGDVCMFAFTFCLISPRNLLYLSGQHLP